MAAKLKLDPGELTSLQERLAASLLKERGWKARDILWLLKTTTAAEAEELYRRLILAAFLEERKEGLQDRDHSLLGKVEEGKLGTSPSKKSVLIVLPQDLDDYTLPQLVILSGDSLEDLLPARTDFFREQARLAKENEEAAPQEQCLEQEGEEGEDEDGDGDEDGDKDRTEDPVPGPKIVNYWGELGKQLSREIFRNCRHAPPPGYSARKVGRGWVFTQEKEEDLFSQGPRMLFVRLGLPLVSQGFQEYRERQKELRKETLRHKAENKKLLKTIEDLKADLKNLKKKELTSHRQARELKRSNKKIKRRLKTSKDESDYDHMYQ